MLAIREQQEQWRFIFLLIKNVKMTFKLGIGIKWRVHFVLFRASSGV